MARTPIPNIPKMTLNAPARTVSFKTTPSTSGKTESFLSSIGLIQDTAQSVTSAMEDASNENLRREKEALAVEQRVKSEERRELGFRLRLQEKQDAEAAAQRKADKEASEAAAEERRLEANQRTLLMVTGSGDRQGVGQYFRQAMESGDTAITTGMAEVILDDVTTTSMQMAKAELASIKGTAAIKDFNITESATRHAQEILSQQGYGLTLQEIVQSASDDKAAINKQLSKFQNSRTNLIDNAVTAKASWAKDQRALIKTSELDRRENIYSARFYSDDTDESRNFVKDMMANMQKAENLNVSPDDAAERALNVLGTHAERIEFHATRGNYQLAQEEYAKWLEATEVAQAPIDTNGDGKADMASPLQGKSKEIEALKDKTLRSITKGETLNLAQDQAIRNTVGRINDLTSRGKLNEAQVLLEKNRTDIIESKMPSENKEVMLGRFSGSEANIQTALLRDADIVNASTKALDQPDPNKYMTNYKRTDKALTDPAIEDALLRNFPIGFKDDFETFGTNLMQLDSMSELSQVNPAKILSDALDNTSINSEEDFVNVAERLDEVRINTGSYRELLASSTEAELIHNIKNGFKYLQLGGRGNMYDIYKEATTRGTDPVLDSNQRNVRREAIAELETTELTVNVERALGFDALFPDQTVSIDLSDSMVKTAAEKHMQQMQVIAPELNSSQLLKSFKKYVEDGQLISSTGQFMVSPDNLGSTKKRVEAYESDFIRDTMDLVVAEMYTRDNSETNVRAVNNELEWVENNYDDFRYRQSGTKGQWTIIQGLSKETGEYEDLYTDLYGQYKVPTNRLNDYYISTKALRDSRGKTQVKKTKEINQNLERSRLGILNSN